MHTRVVVMRLFRIARVVLDLLPHVRRHVVGTTRRATTRLAVAAVSTAAATGCGSFDRRAKGLDLPDADIGGSGQQACVRAILHGTLLATDSGHVQGLKPDPCHMESVRLNSGLTAFLYILSAMHRVQIQQEPRRLSLFRQSSHPAPLRWSASRRPHAAQVATTRAHAARNLSSKRNRCTG